MRVAMVLPQVAEVSLHRTLAGQIVKEGGNFLVAGANL